LRSNVLALHDVVPDLRHWVILLSAGSTPGKAECDGTTHLENIERLVEAD
jgi:hypothetical protein